MRLLLRVKKKRMTSLWRRKTTITTWYACVQRLFPRDAWFSIAMYVTSSRSLAPQNEHFDDDEGYDDDFDDGGGDDAIY